MLKRQSPGLIRVDGSSQCHVVAVASPETVSGQYAELDFRHVQPTGVFGGVVAEGEFRIPGNAARRLARVVRGPLGDGAVERLEGLTDREAEILKQFAEGLSYQEIGDMREISALPVRNAVSGVQKKLGFRTRQQMVVWAIRAGVVDSGSA